MLLNKRLQEVIFGYLKEAGDEQEEFKLRCFQCFYLTISFENENKGENEITRKLFDYLLQNVDKFQSKKLVMKIARLFQIYSLALNLKSTFEEIFLQLENKFGYLLDVDQNALPEQRLWLYTVFQFVCSLQIKVFFVYYLFFKISKFKFL